MLDRVGAGSIDTADLELLLLALNINLTPAETTLTKNQLVDSVAGRIDFETFYKWWEIPKK